MKVPPDVVTVASMEPRSFDRGDIERMMTQADNDRLQWSRGLLTAETGVHRHRADVHATASMEPRSFDRGDGNRTNPLGRNRNRLQWSRGLLTAETRLYERTLSVTEIASMEPRSFDRGDPRDLFSLRE